MPDAKQLKHFNKTEQARVCANALTLNSQLRANYYKSASRSHRLKRKECFV